MKSAILYLPTLLLFTICISCSTAKLSTENIMSPEQGRKSAIVTETQDLEISLTTDKDSYEVGEPIYVTAYLKNTSDKTIKVFKYLRPGEGGLELEIRPVEGKNFQYIPLEEADHDKTSKINLRPNQEIGEAFPIFFGGHGWSFTQNGVHEISGTYMTKHEDGQFLSVTAKPIKIDVIDNENKVISSLVSGSKASYQSGLFMTWQAGDHLTDGKRMLDQVLKLNTKSALNNYINLAMGKSYSDHFMDYRSKYPRQANYDLAKRYLNSVNLNALPKYLQIQYHLAMIKCNYNHKIQNKDVTIKHFDAIEKLVKRDVAYKSIMRQVNEMRERVK